MLQEQTKPIAPFIGGKFKLAKRICQIIDNDNHNLYAEPFVGMGGIFFRRSKPVKVEFINDYNKDISNLFLILREHYKPFLEGLQFLIASQAEFNRQKNTNPEMLTDINRAIRFYYLQRLVFGGRVTGQTFGVSNERRSRFDLNKLESNLKSMCDRLRNATIMCGNYSEFITRVDREYTFFYLDPPYFNNENDYGKGLFERSDFERIAEQLVGIKGKFLMSINDTPEIRSLFKRFNIIEIQTSYSISDKIKGRGTRVELLISNFKCKD